MKFDVLSKELPERYVASVRAVIPTYDSESILWNRLCSETAAQNMKFSDSCYSMAIFHDPEHKESDVDVEVQVAVKGSYKDTENVVFKTEPAVLIASCTFKGPYMLLNEAIAAVAAWVNDNGYVFAGDGFCIYHVSPGQTNDPNEYVTELGYPIAKK